MVEESILLKIKKALALANDSDSNEAQTAMLMAQRLMAKHGIDISEVEEVEQQTKEVDDETIVGRGRTPSWKKRLASVIAENFRCTNYTRTWGGKSSIHFIGLKGDIEIAKSVFEFAVGVLETTCSAYINNIKKQGVEFDAYGLRNDFRIGFINGLKQKYKEQVEQLNLSLVLVQDALVIQEVEKKGLRTIRVGNNARRSGDKDAYNNGFNTGKNLGSNRLTTQ